MRYGAEVTPVESVEKQSVGSGGIGNITRLLRPSILSPIPSKSTSIV